MTGQTPYGQPPPSPQKPGADKRPLPPAPSPVPPPLVPSVVPPGGVDSAPAMAHQLPEHDRVWYDEFREIIREKIGFVLPVDPQPMLRSFVQMRLRVREVPNVRRYLLHLRHASFGDAELTAIINAITIKKTHFFRDIVQFEGVRDHLRKLAARRGDVRIWCAGCSTGEEPFSVAMIAAAEGIPLDLKASDVNTDALATARQAQYTDLTIGEIPEEFKRRFLIHLDRGYMVDPKIRRVPAFVHHNLMSDQFLKPAVGLWDVIFCRNVLIYFDRPTVEAVVAKFHRVLAPDGRLILGAGESLHGKVADFELVRLGRSFSYRPLVVGKKTSESSVDLTIPWQLIGIHPPDDDADDADDDGAILGVLPRFGPEDVLHGSLPPIASSSSSAGVVGAGGVDGKTAADELDLARFAMEFRIGGTTRKAALDRLREAMHKRPNVPGLLTLGNALLQAGDLQGALDAYSDAQIIEPLCIEAHYLIGLVHKKAGARWPAIQAFRRALFLDPAFWPASFYLAGMYAAENMPSEAQREYANTLRAISRPASAGLTFASQLAEEAMPSRFRDEVIAVCRSKLARP